MKPGDFFLDLQDIIGKLIPGFLTLTALYLLFGFPVADETLSQFYKDYQGLCYILIFIISYFSGEMILFLAFLIRDNLHENKFNILKLGSFLGKVDKSGKISSKFETHFGKDKLDEPYRDLHWYCKKIIMDELPTAYKRIKKYEAVINFKLSMIIPVGMFSVILFNKGDFLAGCFLAAITYVLYLTAIKDTKSETHLIYVSYYHYLNKKYNFEL